MNLDNLEDSVRTHRGNPGCAMGKLLQSLPDDERDRLRRVAEDPKTSAPKLAAFLTQQGAQGVTRVVVNLHRNKDCGCEKAGLR